MRADVTARHRLPTQAIPLQGRGRHVTGPAAAVLPPMPRTTGTLPLPGTPPDGQQLLTRRPPGMKARTIPPHREDKEHAVADADTVAPSSAELWVRYHRKVLIQFVPLVLAALTAVHTAVQDGSGVSGHEVVAVVLAVAVAVGTYVPGSAVLKLAASGVFAIANGVNLAIDDFSWANVTLIGVQLTAWLVAGTVENGARPDVVEGEIVDGPVDSPVTGSGAPYDEASRGE